MADAYSLFDFIAKVQGISQAEANQFWAYASVGERNTWTQAYNAFMADVNIKTMPPTTLEDAPKYAPGAAPAAVARTTETPYGGTTEPEIGSQAWYDARQAASVGQTPYWTVDEGGQQYAAPLGITQAEGQLGAQMGALPTVGQFQAGAYGPSISEMTTNAYTAATDPSFVTDYGLSDSIDATTKYLADLQMLYQMSTLGEASEQRKANFVLGNKQLDIWEELGLGQLAVEGQKARFGYEIGLGQIALGFEQLDVQKLLGLATIGVQQQSIQSLERIANQQLSAQEKASAAAQKQASAGLAAQQAAAAAALAEQKREFDLKNALDTLATKGGLALNATELLQNLTKGPQNWERYWYLSRGEGAPTPESQPAYDAVYNLVRQMSTWSFGEEATPAPKTTQERTQVYGAQLGDILQSGQMAAEQGPGWVQAYKQFRQPQYQWAGAG